eukprot:1161972-Pelagomonas_calceolata.AAC.7
MSWSLCCAAEQARAHLCFVLCQFTICTEGTALTKCAGACAVQQNKLQHINALHFVSAPYALKGQVLD